MEWLTQNWIWIALALGAVWLFSRRGLAGCGMGGHSGHLGHGGHGGHGTGSATGSGGAPGGGAMRGQTPDSGGAAQRAVDPVSGREVATAQALTSVHQGGIFYFENAENRRQFEAAPQQYAPAAAPAPKPQRHRGCC